MESLESHLLNFVLPGLARPILAILVKNFQARKFLTVILGFFLLYSGKPYILFLSAWIEAYRPQPTTCTIPQSDPSFDIVIWWFLRQQSWVLRARSVLATCDPAARTGFFLINPPELESKDYQTPISFSPYDAAIPFRWRGSIFLFKRVGRSKGNEDPNTLILQCFGSILHIHQLLEECRRQYELSHDKCSVFHHTKGGWERTSNLKPRALSTVVLRDGVRDLLLGEIREYLSPEHREWLQKRGQPVRKGYLLHGPPGTEKSSLPQALASEAHLDLYVVDLLGLNNERLFALFRSLPEKCMVLIEDIDDWHTKVKSEDTAGLFVSMSALLNVIDGASTQEGRVLFITTNNRDELDGALVRKGRIDREVRLGEVDKDMAQELFLLIFGLDAQPKEDMHPQLAAKAIQFGEQVPAGTYTAAQIISFLVEQKGLPDKALQAFGAWDESQRQSRGCIQKELE
ncbi:P-loop containing nucleoside triphosphate hydrolase protein [Astrocystis sublimbata]|nr:P-loop containing nucleoside triphosphate hydrolase protein [Astrocystis sublimbata]